MSSHRKSIRKKKPAVRYGVETPLAFEAAIAALNEMVMESVVGRLPYTYQAYLKSKFWKQRREIYLEHYRGFCQRCHKVKSPLQLHHVTYERLRTENLEDLLLVCKSCHVKEELTKEVGL